MGKNLVYININTLSDKVHVKNVKMTPTSVNIIILPFVIECLYWAAISCDAWWISSGISDSGCHINVLQMGISKNSFCQERLCLVWLDFQTVVYSLTFSHFDVIFGAVY